MNEVEVIDTGYLPHEHQAAVHQAMLTHRFGVLVCHRRFGKTVAAVNQLIDAGIRFPGGDGRFGYVAPYLKQAREITWDLFKKYLGHVPGVQFQESSSTIRFENGNRIRLFGTNEGQSETIRGTFFDGVVCDEIADFPPDTWGSILRPAVSDRRGWVMFIGTPKGLDTFYDLYAYGQGQKDWFTAMYRADETDLPWLGEEELALAKHSMSDAQYRQEFLCDFSASSDDVLISIDLITESCARFIDLRELEGLPKVLGVDPARFGDDKSVMIKRQGLAIVGQPFVFDGLDNMQLAGRVAQEIDTWTPDAVFIDAGRGEGVIDRLRQLGYAPIEINFGSRASNPRFANKRAEMWDNLKQWLIQGGSLPNHAALKSDLITPTYSFDAANRMKLEPKEKIKKRIGRSPDLGDALALTFAMPIAARSMFSAVPGRGNQANEFVEHDYDPINVPYSTVIH